MAALTIPGLIVNNQEKETVVQLKKAYNVLNNAYSLAKIEYGDPNLYRDGGSTATPTANNGWMDRMSKFLNISKRCDQGYGCFPKNVKYKKMDGTFEEWTEDQRSDVSKAILADGMSFNILAWQGCDWPRGEGALEKICGRIYIDVNGFKKPNHWGKDMFAFWITEDAIMPMGTPTDEVKLSTNCTGSSGVGCAAWVILKENLNYPPYGTGWE